MRELVFALLLGMGGGGVYAMLGTGIVTAYKGSGIINFAHGAFAVYAAFAYDQLRTSGQFALPWVDVLPGRLNLPVMVRLQHHGTSQLVAVTVSLVLVAFIGLLAHLLVFRPLRRAPALGKVIGSLGVMLYLQAVVLLNYGSGARAPQGLLPKEPILNFLGLGKNMPRLDVYMAAAAVLMGAAVWALLRFSRVGLATRAADENEKGAVLLGLSPQLLAGLNWVLSAVLAGIAGLLWVGAGSLDATGFTLLIVPALGAALIGRLTSIPLATAGGLALGMFQAGTVEVTQRSWWPRQLPPTGVREAVPVMVIGCFLYFRGDRLPVRGTVAQRRLPRAPEPRHVIAGTIVPVVIVVFLATSFTSNWAVALTTSLLATMLMLSWVVITGYLGQISLAQLSLAGIAAYTAARLSANVEKVSQFDLLSVRGPNLPDPIAALLGVVAAVALGLLIGLPAVRIRGVQLAVMTLAAVAPISMLLMRNEWLFGAAAASNYPIPRPTYFGVYVGATDPQTSFTDYWAFTAFAIVALLVLCLAVVGLRRGSTGRRFLAVRANERAAAAVGINVARTKLLGFGIAAAIAGVAGVLQSYRLGTIRPDSYSLFVGLALFAFVYLGGITTVYGAVIGGLLVGGGLIAEFIDIHTSTGFDDYILLIGAVGLILTAILDPEGIALAGADALQRMRACLNRGRAATRPTPSDERAVVAAAARSH